jgi:thymidylate synthase (FAD)
VSQFKVKIVSITQMDDEFLRELRNEINTDMSLPKEEALEFLDILSSPEALMAYTARVSSPKQVNPKFDRLLAYCIEHHHWSVFEMVDATFEIQTSRAIAQQILRHRSFTFQEFSQRYAAVPKDGFIVYDARRQDNKNRQNSVDDMDQRDKDFFEAAQRSIWHQASELYQEALNRGIAKECARFLLPLNTKTKLYMKGSLRSWIHYVELRGGNGTQKEHLDIAVAIKDVLVRKFPIVAKAMGWRE